MKVGFENRLEVVPRGFARMEDDSTKDGNRFKMFLGKVYPESTSRSSSGVMRKSFLGRIVSYLKGKFDADKNFKFYVRKKGWIQAHGYH